MAAAFTPAISAGEIIATGRWAESSEDNFISPFDSGVCRTSAKGDACSFKLSGTNLTSSAFKTACLTGTSTMLLSILQGIIIK